MPLEYFSACSPSHSSVQCCRLLLAVIEETKTKPGLIRAQNQEVSKRGGGGDLTAKGLSSAGVAQLILSCALSTETGLSLLITRSKNAPRVHFFTLFLEHFGVQA